MYICMHMCVRIQRLIMSKTQSAQIPHKIKISVIPSRLIPIHQQLHDNICTWAHDVHLDTSSAQVQELP